MTISEVEDDYGFEDEDLMEGSEDEIEETILVASESGKRPLGKRRKKKVTSRKLWQ